MLVNLAQLQNMQTNSVTDNFGLQNMQVNSVIDNFMPPAPAAAGAALQNMQFGSFSGDQTTLSLQNMQVNSVIDNCLQNLSGPVTMGSNKKL